MSSFYSHINLICHLQFLPFTLWSLSHPSTRHRWDCLSWSELLERSFRPITPKGNLLTTFTLNCLGYWYTYLPQLHHPLNGRHYGFPTIVLIIAVILVSTWTYHYSCSAFLAPITPTQMIHSGPSLHMTRWAPVVFFVFTSQLSNHMVRLQTLSSPMMALYANIWFQISCFLIQSLSIHSIPPPSPSITSLFYFLSFFLF